MKSASFVIITALVLFSFLPCQAYDLTYGLKAGLTLCYNPEFSSTQDPHPYWVSMDEKIYQGYALGLYAEQYINDVLSLQAELLYAIKGSATDFTEQCYNCDAIERKITLHYLELSILPKLIIMDTDEVNPYFIFGPTLAFNSFAEVKLPNQTKSIQDQFKPTDVLFTGGIGFELVNIYEKDAFFEFRVNYGLGDITDNDSWALETDVEPVRNLAYYLMFGFAF